MQKSSRLPPDHSHRQIHLPHAYGCPRPASTRQMQRRFSGHAHMCRRRCSCTRPCCRYKLISIQKCSDKLGIAIYKMRLSQLRGLQLHAVGRKFCLHRFQQVVIIAADRETSIKVRFHPCLRHRKHRECQRQRSGSFCLHRHAKRLSLGIIPREALSQAVNQLRLSAGCKWQAIQKQKQGCQRNFCLPLVSRRVRPHRLR